MPEETKETQGQSREADSEAAYQNTIKEILSATDYESNTRAETDTATKADSEEENSDDTQDPGEKKEAGKPVEKGQIKDKPEDEGKETEILGKTPKEIEDLINQRTQEALKKHEDSLKDYYEAEKSEMVTSSRIGQLEQVLKEYNVSLVQIDEMFQKGDITAEQYKNAIKQANADISELKTKHAELQKANQQSNIPKVKRVNNEYYQKIQAEMPELKDPIVKKYAENLKEKIYDTGGIDIAKGGFAAYVRDFIAPAVAEAEIRGYQKIKNEIEKNNAKAKAKTATPSGSDVQTKTSIRTADDIQNASKEDWLKFVLN